MISIVDNELRIRSLHTAMAELQAEAERFLQSDAASVEAFIAQRRAEVDGEEESTLKPGNPGISVVTGPHR